MYNITVEALTSLDKNHIHVQDLAHPTQYTSMHVQCRARYLLDYAAEMDHIPIFHL